MNLFDCYTVILKPNKGVVCSIILVDDCRYALNYNFEELIVFHKH